MPAVFKKDNAARLLPATPSASLDATGLVALADLTTIQQRTALTGTASLWDVFVLCPGIHMQQQSPELNGGEYPACAALTTGYVFRVENSATVFYLQQVSLTGHLTTLVVAPPPPSANVPWYRWRPLRRRQLVASLAYVLAVLSTLAVVILVGFSRDWWGLTMIFFLMFARLCNVIVIRRRAVSGWSGAPEPGVKGDLLVLLSQDRWVRITGAVDDLKLVTSGQWIRDQTHIEGWITALATVVVYLTAALASNVEQFGKILLLALLIGSVGLLAVANVATDELQMHGRTLRVSAGPKLYKRRLDLANELIKQTGRDNWAVRLGMIVKSDSRSDDMKATM